MGKETKINQNNPGYFNSTGTQQLHGIKFYCLHGNTSDKKGVPELSSCSTLNLYADYRVHGRTMCL